jgi:hypothetical protein
MAKRPALSEDSFLKHLFSPKKNPLPTGIRKTTLKPAKGRTKARVAAFNRMSPANQELLKRAGLREAYLQGKASTKDAKSALRTIAVSKGHAKPLRSKGKAAPASPLSSLDAQVALHVIRTLRSDGLSVDDDRIIKYTPYVPEDDKTSLLNASSGRIRAYASDRNNLVIVDGQEVNPMWYHVS